MIPDSKLFFSGTDRVTVILPIHVVCCGCQRSDFVNAPCQVSRQILAILLPPHRLRSIANQSFVVRALPRRPPPLSSLGCIPKHCQSVHCKAMSTILTSRTSFRSLVIHMSSNLLQLPIQLYPCLDALFPAQNTAQHDGLLDLGVSATL